MTDITRQDLKTMSPAEITEAMHDGRLAHLGIGQAPPSTETGQLPRSAVNGMTPDQIEHARAAGRFNEALGIETPSPNKENNHV